MSTELPPLPEHAMRAAPVGQEAWPFPRVGYYTAEQMRAYARAAVEAEREACALVCDEAAKGYSGSGMDMAYAASEWIAAAIRQRGKQ